MRSALLKLKPIASFGIFVYLILLISGFVQFFSLWWLEKQLPSTEFSQFSAVFGYLPSYVLLLELGLGNEILKRFYASKEDDLEFLKTSFFVKALGILIALVLLQVHLTINGVTGHFRLQASIAILSLIGLLPLQFAELKGVSVGKFLLASSSRIGRIIGWLVMVSIITETKNINFGILAYSAVHFILGFAFFFQTDFAKILRHNSAERFYRNAGRMLPWIYLVCTQYLGQAAFATFVFSSKGENNLGAFYFSNSMIAPLSLLCALAFQISWKESLRSGSQNWSGGKFLVYSSKTLIAAVGATIAYLIVMHYLLKFQILVSRLEEHVVWKELLPLSFFSCFSSFQGTLIGFQQSKGHHRMALISNVIPVVFLLCFFSSRIVPIGNTPVSVVFVGLSILSLAYTCFTILTIKPKPLANTEA